MAPAGKNAERLRRELNARRVGIGLAVAAFGLASIATRPTFGLVILVIAVGGCIEFANLARRMGAPVCLPLAAAGCVAYPILAYAGFLGRDESLLTAALVGGAFVVLLGAVRERYLERVALTVLCVLYVGKLLSYFILLRTGPHGAVVTLWLVIVVALTDTAGMLVGVWAGRRLLAPLISPSKSWEGAAGALAAATLGGWIVWRLCGIPGPAWAPAGLSAVVSMAAILGDLAESAVKRNAQVKDAGAVLASHGGVLDRFDSYIFAGAIGYAVLSASGIL